MGGSAEYKHLAVLSYFDMIGIHRQSNGDMRAVIKFPRKRHQLEDVIRLRSAALVVAEALHLRMILSVFR